MRMFAWYDKKKDEYLHIYRRKCLVETCSPDGFKWKTEHGEGEIVEVEVKRINHERERRGKRRKS